LIVFSTRIITIYTTKLWNCYAVLNYSKNCVFAVASVASFHQIGKMPTCKGASAPLNPQNNSDINRLKGIQIE